MNRVILILFLVGTLSSCKAFTNRFPAEKIDPSTVFSDSGIVIISTGAKKSCISFATFLMLQPAGSAYGKNQLVALPVDGSFSQGDFIDHQGHLDVIPLKAGSYQLIPWVANPDVSAVKIPKAEFKVAAGEIVYVGEYWMPVACGFATVNVMRDSSERDLSLLKLKNPYFNNAHISKRIAKFTGFASRDGK